jgi:NAD(P)-dependent dehydrogenase (short-subunit alcohol dehydrogenase family)
MDKAGKTRHGKAAKGEGETMDLKLTGRTALVTGSSKGIGLSVAQWFAREGVNVCLVARSGDRLEKEGAAIAKETGVTVRTLAADLAEAAARERVFQTFPDVDILVNNAGAIPGGSLDDVDEAAWRAGWDLKVYGYVGLTRLYLRMMRERKRVGRREPLAGELCQNALRPAGVDRRDRGDGGVSCFRSVVVHERHHRHDRRRDRQQWWNAVGG